jgi:hypothetical protein
MFHWVELIEQDQRPIPPEQHQHKQRCSRCEKVWTGPRGSGGKCEGQNNYRRELDEWGRG